ncbi:DUF3139 domain-containing protein [Halobacillus sp. KGW1]|uniref:DUF3139 domain-containing protein n=1 Tax=Halobacillus sp. KGW1 TaxID=1793726 RepID=UPI000782ECEE|nr:DUF3139 domain-containing protein [Halobacillus sp. KGW1]
MKKMGAIVFSVLLIIGIGFGYVQYKKVSVEQRVMEYLTTEKHLKESDIVSSEPFIANLRGDKNWMVSVRLKDDERTYYYYRSKGKVVLESYVEDGVEHAP